MGTAHMSPPFYTLKPIHFIQKNRLLHVSVCVYTGTYFTPLNNEHCVKAVLVHMNSANSIPLPDNHMHNTGSLIHIV